MSIRTFSIVRIEITPMKDGSAELALTLAPQDNIGTDQVYYYELPPQFYLDSMVRLLAGTDIADIVIAPSVKPEHDTRTKKTVMQ